MNEAVQSEFAKIRQYFPELSEKQYIQLEQLYPLYLDWNQKINVISRKDIDHLYLHHVLHSLSIAKVVQFLPGSHVLDVGTGGGFPGIPLAILHPKTQFHLVDSVGKKIRVVEIVAEALELKNVQASHMRIEKDKGRYDFAVTRAVAPLNQLYQWTRQRIKVKSQHELFNGLICLKGGNLEQEIKEVQLNYQCFPISDFIPEEYFEEKYVLYVPL
ncbi:MAG: 16S rRNA (guanine(527)-N(7))-methyltransferase RsmG [Cyclobacteriaceae bacterium]